MKGKLLTPAQSVRLAVLQSVDKQRAIELIAEHLRNAVAADYKLKMRTPRDWYGKTEQAKGVKR